MNFPLICYKIIKQRWSGLALQAVRRTRTVRNRAENFIFDLAEMAEWSCSASGTSNEHDSKSCQKLYIRPCRDGGVVERARLEIVLRRNTYGGSNPSLCAKYRQAHLCLPVFVEGMKNPRGAREAACRRCFAEGSRLRETAKSLSLLHF